MATGRFVRREGKPVQAGDDQLRDPSGCDAPFAAPAQALHNAPVPGLSVQRAVVVGAAGDPLELEAERVAASVVATLRRRVDTDLAHQHAQDRSHDHAREGGEHDGSPVGLAGGALDRSTAALLQTSRGSGRALPTALRQSMEGALGADLTAVRLHDGPAATTLNRSMSALAFTHGRDIYFRDGVPDAASDAGLHLLAHELTHTVQQGTAPRSARSDHGSVRRHVSTGRNVAVIRRKVKPAMAEATLASLLKEHDQEQWYSDNWRSGDVQRIAAQVAGLDDTDKSNLKSRLVNHDEINPRLRDYRMEHDEAAPDSAVDGLAAGRRIGGMHGDVLQDALRLIWRTYKQMVFYHVSGAADQIRQTGLDPLWGGSDAGLANTQSVPNKHDHNVRNSKNRVFVTRKQSEVRQYMGKGKGELRVMIPPALQAALKVDPDSQFGLFLEETSPVKPTVLLKGMDRLNARLGPEAWYSFTLAVNEASAGLAYGEALRDFLPELYDLLFQAGLFGEGKVEQIVDLAEVHLAGIAAGEKLARTILSSLSGSDPVDDPGGGSAS